MKERKPKSRFQTLEVTTKGDEVTVEIERLAGMYDMGQHQNR